LRSRLPQAQELCDRLSPWHRPAVGVKRREQPSPELGRALQVLKKIMPSVKAKPEPKPKKTYPRNVN
jgi:hypothetical protein